MCIVGNIFNFHKELIRICTINENLAAICIQYFIAILYSMSSHRAMLYRSSITVTTQDILCYSNFFHPKFSPVFF